MKLHLFEYKYPLTEKSARAIKREKKGRDCKTFEVRPIDISTFNYLLEDSNKELLFSLKKLRVVDTSLSFKESLLKINFETEKTENGNFETGQENRSV